jgi:hypothetical protein
MINLISEVFAIPAAKDENVFCARGELPEEVLIITQFGNSTFDTKILITDRFLNNH